MEKCINLKRIEKMETAIFGDDQPGLKVIVAQLVVTVENVTKALHNSSEVQKEASKVQRAILKFMDEERGKGEAKSEYTIARRWLIGTTITLAGLLITSIIALIKYAL